ncbi:MAG TPA: DASH family cryptochrome [Flavobacteriales bacterium]|nr:DASH family cryptochrome [Flavobacteriales bacterium]
MSRAILWFRNDQRLADNAALAAALAAHDEVLPLLIIDPRQHGPGPFGFERSGPFRRRFIREGIADLGAQLRAKGSALHVRVGEPAQVIAHLQETWGADAVHAQQLFAREEQRQEREVVAVADLCLHAPNTLLLPGDLPFVLEKLPQVFTAFRHKVEKLSPVRDPLPEPLRIPSPKEWKGRALDHDVLPHAPIADDPRAALRFTGGRAAALARLKHYLWDTRALSTYKETRNGLIGADYSSKLSPWLASGALSAREVWHAVKRYEAEHGANESTYWLGFELLWRDFFQFTGAKHGADLFKRAGIVHKPVKGNNDSRRFAAWCEGRTGQPFIDANIRELAATGWMSNRGRQNVASYLVHDLGLDWRMGAWWFERMLIDYDPCSNWGNWQYVAGVGNDPREGRRFDPERQAGMYDPERAYVGLWGIS